MGSQTCYKTGFPPGTGKRIHIAIDGEACLKKGLAKLFLEATFALDIILFLPPTFLFLTLSIVSGSAGL